MFSFFKKSSKQMGSGSSVADERKARRDALKAQREAEREERDKARKLSKAQSAAAEKAAEEALARQQAEAEAEQAALAKQLQNQLSNFQTYMRENAIVPPSLDDTADAGAGTAASSIHPGRKPIGADETVADAENISIHSSDLADEDLLQGLQDLDDELEQDFQNQVDALQEQIDAHKAEAIRLLREENDKPSALQEMQRAKAVEAQLTALRTEHEKPIGARIEEAKEQADELEDQVKEKKQEALAKLRAGEKPVALEIMREVKGLESQLEAAKATYESLVRERDSQLRAGMTSK